MTERGKVREVSGELVIIEADNSSVCFGCLNYECKSRGTQISAENKKALPIKAGQTVEVMAHSSSLLGQALVSILPPAVSFALGFIIIRHLFPHAGEGAAAGAIFA
jgi:positive regulator of sigma E activity